MGSLSRTRAIERFKHEFRSELEALAIPVGTRLEVVESFFDEDQDQCLREQIVVRTEDGAELMLHGEVQIYDPEYSFDDEVNNVAEYLGLLDPGLDEARAVEVLKAVTDRLERVDDPEKFQAHYGKDAA